MTINRLKTARLGLPDESRPRWCSEVCLLEQVHKAKSSSKSQVLKLKEEVANLKKANNSLKRSVRNKLKVVPVAPSAVKICAIEQVLC